MEVAGPGDFQLWSMAWQVFRNAMIMLDAADLGTLDAYHDHIADYFSIYGQECWLTLYQTDLRARLEVMGRVRLDLLQDHQDAVQRGSGYST